MGVGLGLCTLNTFDKSVAFSLKQNSVRGHRGAAQETTTAPRVLPRLMR